MDQINTKESCVNFMVQTPGKIYRELESLNVTHQVSDITTTLAKVDTLINLLYNYKRCLIFLANASKAPKL